MLVYRVVRADGSAVNTKIYTRLSDARLLARNDNFIQATELGRWDTVEWVSK